MKIAILVSSLSNKGGDERLVYLNAKYFDADIYVGTYNPKTTFKEFKDCRMRVLHKKRSNRITSLIVRNKFKKLKLKNYDAFIYHGGAALEAARNHKNNVWYCNSPTRWLYDLYPEELRKFKFCKRQLFRIVTHFLRKSDQKNVSFIDKILTNSNNIKARVKRFYNLNSTVVYPPVNTAKFKFKKFGDFYLSAARVDPIKRVHLIVKAFQKMPEKKLIVASGGPDLERIRGMAKGYDNIAVLGWISEKKLFELQGKCLANIYMTYKEDFGLVPIESMSAGKPCIATNQGGMKETIVHKKTGLLIEPKIEEIMAAVKWMTRDRAKKMKRACQERAKLFSEEKYLKGMENAIKSLLKK